MLNVVAVEGYTTRRRWRRGGYHYLRIAVFRDPDRPRKESEESDQHRDQPDYLTVKVPPELFTTVLNIRAGQRVRIVGWLESDECREPLRQLLRHEGIDVPPGLDADSIAISQATTQVVADRIIPIPLQDQDREDNDAAP